MDALSDRLAQHGLEIVGVAPEAGRTLILIGPGAQMWAHFTGSDEYNSDIPDRLDQWSARILEQLAREYSGELFLPSDGPPYPPFVKWALESQTIWQSPIGLLVHRDRGLLISFRGALLLDLPYSTPPDDNSPCHQCAQPCRSTCPVDAFLPHGFDEQACKAHLRSDAGKECLTKGCLARRSCPQNKKGQTMPDQLAFSMRQFLLRSAENSS